MKRSGFAKPSYESALAARIASQARQREKASQRLSQEKRATGKPRTRKSSLSQRRSKPLKRVSDASKLKNSVWRQFSIFIRKRDANENGLVRCCTCGRAAHWKGAHAGHFLPQRRNAILFDERGVHAQCLECNINIGGNPEEYEKFMLEKYGLEVVEELRRQSTQTVKWLPDELKSLLAHYRSVNAGDIDPNAEAQLCQ